MTLDKTQPCHVLRTSKVDEIFSARMALINDENKTQNHSKSHILQELNTKYSLCLIGVRLLDMISARDLYYIKI